MFGYITPLKSELKVREFEVYNAYYCAICHAVKRLYGELPRLMLSFDAALVALLADALSEDGTPVFETFRCFNNPLKKRNEAAPSAAIDYAADVMVLLGYLSLKDGKADRDAGEALKTFAVSAGASVIGGAGRRAAARLGGKALVCEAQYEAQRALEAEKVDSIDRAADPTGRMMEELMDFTDAPGLREFGYHLGRYIYIIDAVDDLEKDKKYGAYNPLLLHPEPADALETALSLDLAKLGELAEGLPLRRNKGIIDNIVYLGLRARADEVFARFSCRGSQV